jgi:hypothetical protein
MNVAEILGTREATSEELERQRRQATVREVLWAIVEQDEAGESDQAGLAWRICGDRGLNLVDRHDFGFALQAFKFEQAQAEPQPGQDSPVRDEIRILVKQVTEQELATAALLRQAAGNLNLG